MLRRRSRSRKAFVPFTGTLLVLAPALPTLAQTARPAGSSLASTADCSDLSDAPCPPPPAFHSPKPQTETSVSLGVFAQLTPTRLQTSSFGQQETSVFSQGIGPTPGVLGTVRQQFRPWLGYSVNMGYTRVDERYTFPSFTSPRSSELHIPSNLYEFSLSYVAQKHLTPRLTGFANLGAGAMIALPINRSGAPVSPDAAYLYPAVNFRPEGTAGFGLDLRLAQHLALRAEYRGQLYKNPDFGGLQRSTTWTSEPTLSLVYRFGK